MDQSGKKLSSLLAVLLFASVAIFSLTQKGATALAKSCPCKTKIVSINLMDNSVFAAGTGSSLITIPKSEPSNQLNLSWIDKSFVSEEDAAPIPIETSYQRTCSEPS